MKKSKVDYIKYLGKEYGKGAQGPDKFDCWHLTREIVNNFGYEVPKFHVEDDENSFLKMIIANNMDDVVEEIEKPEDGCIVGLMIRPPYLTHIGIVIMDNGIPKFLHILKNSRVSVERLDNPLWKKRIKGFYRVKSKWKKTD